MLHQNKQGHQSSQGHPTPRISKSQQKRIQVKRPEKQQSLKRDEKEVRQKNCPPIVQFQDKADMIQLDPSA